MTATTYTNLGIVQPGIGDPSTRNAWGGLLNSDMAMIDALTSQVQSKSVAGTGTTILTFTQGAADEVKHAHFIFTGILTGNRTVLWPQSVQTVFSVQNNTTGAFNLILGADNGGGSAAGTTQTLAQGLAGIYVSDGTNVNVRTSSGSGTVTLAGDASGASDANQVTVTHLAAALPVAQGGTAGITQAAARIGIGAGSGVVGSVRNAKMSITAASASGLFTADEVTVAASLAGNHYTIGTYSQTINLATTGAGGMDTGTAPISGYVSLYAIYKSSDGTTSILACNATTSTASVYGGGNMPSGYTASGLIGIWPTNGSSQFPIGYQINRSVFFAQVTISFTANGSLQSVSLSTAVPAVAKTYDGQISWAGIRIDADITVSPVNSGTGLGAKQFISEMTSATITARRVSFENVPIITSQTTYCAASGGTSNLYVTGYTF